MRLEYEIKLKEQEEEILLEYKPFIDEFVDYCSHYQINLEREHFRFHHTTGIIVDYPNILRILSPELKFNKEKLVNLNQIFALFKQSFKGYGYFENEHYNSCVHPFFKKTNNWRSLNNPRFLKHFIKNRNEQSNYFLKLNEDQVRLNFPDNKYIEADYIFGAKFNKEISKIKNGIVQLKPPTVKNSHRADIIFGDTIVVNIKWKQKEFVKTCEIEEYKNRQVTVSFNNQTYYPVKYLHSEFDLNKKQFRHFDGAIKLLTEQEYENISTSDLNYNQKSNYHTKPLYVKLFKINGFINNNDWAELSTLYMNGQMLLIEYFNGEIPKDVLYFLNE